MEKNITMIGNLATRISLSYEAYGLNEKIIQYLKHFILSNDDSIHILIEKIYNEEAKKEKINPYFQKIKNLFFQINNIRGKLAFNEKKYSLAINFWNTVSKIQPKNLILQFSLGKAYFFTACSIFSQYENKQEISQIEDFDEALTIFKKINTSLYTYEKLDEQHQTLYLYTYLYRGLTHWKKAQYQNYSENIKNAETCFKFIVEKQNFKDYSNKEILECFDYNSLQLFEIVITKVLSEDKKIQKDFCLYNNHFQLIEKLYNITKNQKRKRKRKGEYFPNKVQKLNNGNKKLLNKSTYEKLI